MTNIHKIADSEIYYIMINGKTYEAEIRTDLNGKKTLGVEDSLRDQISNEIWETILNSDNIEDAIKILKTLTKWV